jgi:hypothetical protein
MSKAQSKPYGLENSRFNCSEVKLDGLVKSLKAVTPGKYLSQNQLK